MCVLTIAEQPCVWLYTSQERLEISPGDLVHHSKKLQPNLSTLYSPDFISNSMPPCFTRNNVTKTNILARPVYLSWQIQQTFLYSPITSSDIFSHNTRSCDNFSLFQHYSYVQFAELKYTVQDARDELTYLHLGFVLEIAVVEGFRKYF